MSVDTNFLMEMLKNQYSHRLNEVIEEADVFDNSGNMILSPDLKVRHKDSGYEYTIDHIEGVDDTVQIYLRSPESPRVEPPPEEQSLLGEPKDQDILGEQDPSLRSIEDEIDNKDNKDNQEEAIFVIDQKEFEKEYEVD